MVQTHMLVCLPKSRRRGENLIQSKLPAPVKLVVRFDSGGDQLKLERPGISVRNVGMGELIPGDTDG